jgi:DNA-binding response OmpR family regulator
MGQHTLGASDREVMKNPERPPVAATAGDRLVLDESERLILGVTMPPLLAGEFKLLSYLGARSPTWHSSYELSVRVYHREDAAGRQLVWKYASTLRKRLVMARLDLIELCRRRGYRCRQQLVTLRVDAGVDGLEPVCQDIR